MERTEASLNNSPEISRTKKGGKGLLITLCVLLVLLLGSYLGLCAYVSTLNTFYPNTVVNGVSVGNMTVSQAAKRLEQKLPNRRLDFYLPVSQEAGETTFAKTPAVSLSLSELGLSAEQDFKQPVQNVYHSQRDQIFPLFGWDFLVHLLNRAEPLAASISPDETVFSEMLTLLTDQFSCQPQDTAYSLEEHSIAVVKESNGLFVLENDLRQQIRQAISDPYGNQVSVNGQIVSANTISAQEIYHALSGEMRNATYDAASDSILPEQTGVTFEVASAQTAMDNAAPGETVHIPAEIQRPTVTEEDLKALLFRDILGEAKTHVSGTAARKHNVALASAAFNGVVLNSGELFSYNETVGQRTVEKGYQPAPAYVKGETVDEIGGGVCQPSSTLYLACLRGNLEITQRHAHRYVPAYIPWGMDATVSWGGPDYQFTNNTDYPIKIITEYANNYLTVQILGTNTTGITAKMTNEVLSTTPWETVYEEDATIPSGTEKVKTTPYTGYSVKTYQHFYDADGKWISSEFEANSNYKMRNQVILKAPGELPNTAPEIPATVPVETIIPTTPPASGDTDASVQELPPIAPIEDLPPVTEN